MFGVVKEVEDGFEVWGVGGEEAEEEGEEGKVASVTDVVGFLCFAGDQRCKRWDEWAMGHYLPR